MFQRAAFTLPEAAARQGRRRRPYVVLRAIHAPGRAGRSCGIAPEGRSEMTPAQRAEEATTVDDPSNSIEPSQASDPDLLIVSITSLELIGTMVHSREAIPLRQHSSSFAHGCVVPRIVRITIAGYPVGN